MSVSINILNMPVKTIKLLVWVVQALQTHMAQKESLSGALS